MAPFTEQDAPTKRSGAWIQGPHDRPIFNEPKGETHALGVVFRPGGLLRYLPGSTAETTNRIRRLGAAAPRLRGSRSVLERVRSQPDPEAALEAVESWMLALTPGVPESTKWIEVIEGLVAGRYARVDEARAILGVSRRYFVEEVRHRAGMTPKTLHLIGRMRRLLQEIDARRPIRWSSEAVGAGYFDQAHAIRDFKRFTGLTPTEYVERRRLAWGLDVEPGEAPNFVPELIR